MISVPGPGNRYFLTPDPSARCQPVQVVRDGRPVEARLLHDNGGLLRFRGERPEDGLFVIGVEAAGHSTTPFDRFSLEIICFQRNHFLKHASLQNTPDTCFPSISAPPWCFAPGI